MTKREKARRNQQKNERKNDREIDKLVSRSGLKGSARKMATQYGKGLLDGMHIAYLAVVTRLLRAGNSTPEIEAFLADLLENSEIEQLLYEAQHPDAAGAE